MTSTPKWLNAEQTQTWLALWSVSEWMPKRLDEQLKRDQSINLHDYFALAQISMAPGERLTMTELAALSDMAPSRLSHVVSRLEARDWVVRTPSPDDRRANIASLTPEGKKFITEAAPGHVAKVLDLVFKDLSEEETRTLGTLLSKILDNLDPPQLPRV